MIVSRVTVIDYERMSSYVDLTLYTYLVCRWTSDTADIHEDGAQCGQ